MLPRHLPFCTSVWQLVNSVPPSIPHQSFAAIGGLSFPAHVPPSGHAEHACKRDTSATDRAHTSIADALGSADESKECGRSGSCVQAAVSVSEMEVQPLQNCCLQCNSLHSDATQPHCYHSLREERTAAKSVPPPQTRRRQSTSQACGSIYRCAQARVAQEYRTFLALARTSVRPAEHSDVSLGICRTKFAGGLARPFLAKRSARISVHTFALKSGRKAHA